MPDITLEEFAKSLHIDPDVLEQQFINTGIKISGGKKTLITDEMKEELLTSLKKARGEQSQEPKKVISRKSASQIKVQRSSGRKTTVSVVTKRRHIYVKIMTYTFF